MFQTITFTQGNLLEARAEALGNAVNTVGGDGQRRFLLEQQVQSNAIPVLGAGNGGLCWAEVRKQIELALYDLNIDILVFEPL